MVAARRQSLARRGQKFKSVSSFYVIFDQGRASSVAISAEQPPARLDLALTRQWLGLAGSGDIRIGSHAVRVDVSDESNVAFLDDAWALAQAKKEEAEKTKTETKTNAELRKKFAAIEDKNFLEHGFNAQVAVDGTVLRIQWALCNRATLTQMFDGDDQANLKEIGFTRVVCSDGFEGYAYFDLTK